MFGRIDPNMMLNVQKVLNTCTAHPGCKDCEYYNLQGTDGTICENAIIRTVSRNCFEPSPNVDSAIYKFNRKNNDINENYLKFLRDAFLQKRKKIVNNLCKEYDKKILTTCLDSLGYDENIRAEAMKADDLHKLYLMLTGEKYED